MIVWSGWGVLVIVIGVLVGGSLTAVVAALVGALGFPQLVVIAPLLGIGGAAVVNWIVGRRLNTRPGREMIDKATGQTFVLRQRHTLFWVPMEWWSAVMAIVAVVAASAALSPRPATKPPAAPANSAAIPGSR